MKIGLKVQPRRGVVAIRGHELGHRLGLIETHKVVLDVQVIPLAQVEEIRSGRADQLAADEKCKAFAVELEGLFRKYELDVWPREVET